MANELNQFLTICPSPDSYAIASFGNILRGYLAESVSYWYPNSFADILNFIRFHIRCCAKKLKERNSKENV